MHVPPLHRRPTAHWLLPPQRQLPEELQVSDRAGSHTAQIPPVTPQVLGKAETWHPLAVQQPVGHEVASQSTQAPATHVWPVTQAGFAPQVHWPLVWQPSARVALQAVHAAAPMPQ